MNSYNGFTPNQRMKAYRWLMEQYASCKRHKPTKCDSCGITKGIIEPHSENYSEPFGNHIGYYGFCYRCHMMLHCRHRNTENFLLYCALVNGGTQLEPFYTRDWSRFKKEMLGTFDLPVYGVSTRTTNILYDIYANLPN